MASSEVEAENNSTPKLPMFSIPAGILESPEHPGMATPPLYTLASVPFTWEEEPGKPRPCTALITLPTTTTTADAPPPKGLEPPPGLLYQLTDSTKLAKTPSPNTVLDGPYNINSRPKFSSSSFRIFGQRRQPSFDSNDEYGSKIPELKKKHFKRKGLFPAWGQRNSKTGKKENGGRFGFSDERSYSSVDMARFRRNGSLSSPSSQTKPHFWATVYEGFKQVIPWKGRKPRKGGPVV